MNLEPKTEPNPDADHDHGGAPHFLPHWIQDRWSVLTVTVAGVALVAGFFATDTTPGVEATATLNPR